MNTDLLQISLKEQPNPQKRLRIQSRNLHQNIPSKKIGWTKQPTKDLWTLNQRGTNDPTSSDRAQLTVQRGCSLRNLRIELPGSYLLSPSPACAFRDLHRKKYLN